MNILTRSIVTLFLSLLCSTAFSQTFASTSQATHLIELYTSEGCSSCPPADKWLNKLKYNPKLWTKFIPVAFHVDYWDYIGWKDPFANAQFSARQRQYARGANLSSVYTPGMLLDGHEWTSWRRQSQLKIPTNHTTGTLSINVADDGMVAAMYQTTEPLSTDLILNIAILGFNVESNVRAGENSRHTFTHDFVVLGFQRIAMKQTDTGIYSGSLEQLPKLSQQADKLAISTWVNTATSLTPLQATGGWIEKLN